MFTPMISNAYQFIYSIFVTKYEAKPRLEDGGQRFEEQDGNCALVMLLHAARGRGLVRAKEQLQDAEVMLPPAGSEARWREEVMPGRASGEVMLALSRQETTK